jgi:hypothetical protein
MHGSLPARAKPLSSLTHILRPCRVMPRGAVAQLGECLTGSQEVVSSILTSSTNYLS